MNQNCRNCKNPLYLPERKWCPVCGYRDTFWNRLKASSLFWWVIAIVAIYIMGSVFNFESGSNANGPTYPLDQSSEASEYNADMLEQDTHIYDPGAAYTEEPLFDPIDPYESTDTDSNATCNIKGNISESGEKIYHIPGQEYYAVTVIDISVGERWFCTEAEARTAGWRKSYK